MDCRMTSRDPQVQSDRVSNRLSRIPRVRDIRVSEPKPFRQSRDREGVAMGRGGPPKGMKVGYRSQRLWGGRGRKRSGLVEAVREFGLERAAEPMSVRRIPPAGKR